MEDTVLVKMWTFPDGWLGELNRKGSIFNMASAVWAVEEQRADMRFLWSDGVKLRELHGRML